MLDTVSVEGKRILRVAEVRRFGGFKGNSTLYDAMSRGRFPRPVAISQKSVGWLEEELLEWRRQRVAERDKRLAEPRKPRRRRKANG
jgi:prophage regulatory protein